MKHTLLLALLASRKTSFLRLNAEFLGGAVAVETMVHGFLQAFIEELVSSF